MKTAKASVRNIMMNVGDTPQAFNGLFRTDAFAVFMKALVLIGSMTSIVLSLDYFDREKIARFEFPVLVVSPPSA